MLRNCVGSNLTFVNSRQLYQKYKNNAYKLREINTTTLTKNDIIYRDDSFSSTNEINILFSGRFSIEKGMLDIVEVIDYLIKRSYNVKMNFLGWENGNKTTVKDAVLNKADELGIKKYVEFHKKRSVGTDLFQMYQNAQIYVVSSHLDAGEGFPRTIWEAMANGCPVVATKVGGIPFFTSHLENIYLVNPRNIDEISAGIIELIKNKNLRRKIISNAYHLVKRITLEEQNKILIDEIKKELQ